MTQRYHHPFRWRSQAQTNEHATSSRISEINILVLDLFGVGWAGMPCGSLEVRIERSYWMAGWRKVVRAHENGKIGVIVRCAEMVKKTSVSNLHYLNH